MRKTAIGMSGSSTSGMFPMSGAGMGMPFGFNNVYPGGGRRRMAPANPLKTMLPPPVSKNNTAEVAQLAAEANQNNMDVAAGNIVTAAYDAYLKQAVAISDFQPLPPAPNVPQAPLLPVAPPPTIPPASPVDMDADVDDPDNEDLKFENISVASDVFKTATSLLKSSYQHSDSKSTIQSATGESQGLGFIHNPDHYARGLDAWKSVSKCFKGGANIKHEPDPFMGVHKSAISLVPEAERQGLWHPPAHPPIPQVPTKKPGAPLNFQAKANQLLKT